MQIERGPYLAVIQPSGAPNCQARVRFHYTITRRAPGSTVVVNGLADTDKEATQRVKEHLAVFAAHEQQELAS